MYKFMAKMLTFQFASGRHSYGLSTRTTSARPDILSVLAVQIKAIIHRNASREANYSSTNNIETSFAENFNLAYITKTYRLSRCRTLRMNTPISATRFAALLKSTCVIS
jgi:hypothetical protein